jgi:hypothetical protein
MSYFIIYKKHDGDGFFAKFNHVLMHLNECDSLNLTPFIDFQSIKSNLRDYTNNETNNEWEYCFIQNNILEDVYNSNHIKCSGEFLGWYPAQGKNFRDKNLTSHFNYLYNKYIKVKPEILEKINPEIEKYKTLAVHCRRSDMVRDHPNIGLNYSEEIFLEKTLKIFNSGGFEKIYLATEEIGIINFFIERLGNKVLYQKDCFRVNLNESPVFKMDDRPLHRTLQCREVLLDALNMSKCDSLLCGVSGVSNATIYINGLKFKDVYYFDEI